MIYQCTQFFFLLLDGFPPDQLSKSLFVLHILLLAARKIITVNWMKMHEPTLTEWTQRLNHIYIYIYIYILLFIYLYTVEIRHFPTNWALIEKVFAGMLSGAF